MPLLARVGFPPVRPNVPHKNKISFHIATFAGFRFLGLGFQFSGLWFRGVLNSNMRAHKRPAPATHTFQAQAVL